MRSNKYRTKIILAIAVGILATLIANSIFSKMNGQINDQQKMIEAMQKMKSDNYKDNYAYAIAKKDLKAGEIVSDEDVDFKQYETMNTNAFENRSEVVNKVLLEDISSGEEFTSAHIAKISNDDATLRAGYRALTLPASNFEGKSDKMKPGTSVDVYSTSADNNWVMENVKIMSAQGGKLGITDATAITFEVPADSISDFISNVSKGNIVLVERNAGDKKVYHKKVKAKTNYSASFASPLPNLPSSVPVSNFSGNNFAGSGLSGLPMPVQPVSQSPSVELIEANVKSKVTFD